MREQPLFEVVDPGTYYVDPDGDPDTPLRVVFTINGEGWRAWPGTYKEGGEDATVGLTIAVPSEVVVDPCHQHAWVDPGPTVADLANALDHLPGFEVVAAVADVSAHGYTGKHLELRVPDLRHDANGGFVDCSEGTFYGWRSPTERSRVLGRYYQGPGQHVGLWILDVDGTRLLIEASWFPRSPAGDRAELQAILASIRIER